ncbi:MAG: hypothetical protein HFI76_06340 [Lachnospiraceae bacterium]|jgi:hypoxanthine-guanine phosphoribosyltransferase|nr:hypothetical protein [Lachnospiraceae bacterium]
MYREEDLVRIAKRENNKKRSYLVVNPLQGKHVPVVPSRALALFQELAKMCKNEYEGEQILVIGFAETATAIGAAVAIAMDSYYIQTTRETISGADYLYFSEEHSHASQQKLVRNEIDDAAEEIERILFVEDEVTTGKTIWNIINVLEKEYPERFCYSVASLLNSMDEEALEKYRIRGIAMHYLVRADHGNYANIAEEYVEDGSYISCNTKPSGKFPEIRIASSMNARRMVQGAAYQSACQLLWKELWTELKGVEDKKILVLGTEEFMYPALFAAAQLEAEGKDVRFHATTRSPIAVSKEMEYPLKERYELKSLYQKDRVTFLYNLERYDLVLILTDAQENVKEGLSALTNAISSKGNLKILLIRWWEE